MPSTNEERRLQLINEKWVKLKEPKSIGTAILLSIPLMIANTLVTLMVFKLVSEVSLKNIGIQGDSISITINLFHIAGVILLLIIHELIHLIFVPNFIKSDKTFAGITLFGGYIYSEEIITKSRYILITIAPFIAISILLPLLLGLSGHLNFFMKFIILLNAMSSSVDILNLILILKQVPTNSSLTSNGMDTYWRSN